MPEDPLGAALGRAVSDVTQGVTRGVSRYHALPPVNKSLFRASVGAALVAACIYVAVELKSARVLADAFLRSPADAPQAVWLPLAVWAVVCGFGVLWFVVGVRAAGDARDTMRAISAGLLTAGFAALLWWRVYPPDDTGILVQAFYIANVVGWGVRFWLSVRRPPPMRLPVNPDMPHGTSTFAKPHDPGFKL